MPPNPARAGMLVVCLVAVPLAAGCSDLHKYWDRSPTAPAPLPDTTPPRVTLLAPTGPDSLHAAAVSGASFMIVIGVIDAGGISRVTLHIDDRAVDVAGPPWQAAWRIAELAEGSVHRLWAEATDLSSNRGVSDTAYARIANAALAPHVTIEFPPNGHQVATRGTLVLSALAIDDVEGPIPHERLAWRSNLDGTLGSGGYLRITNLTVGAHTITATTVNGQDIPGATSIRVEVLAQSTYPFCAKVYSNLLRLRCISCHRPGSPYWSTMQLDLQSYAGVMAGGLTQSHESIAPCRPESSLMWNKLTAEVPWVGSPMPPRDMFPPVPSNLLEELRTWILQGAPPDDPEICP